MIFKFLEFLKNKQIDYIIINGYIELVEDIDRTNDNDILFKKEVFKKIDQILIDFCKKENLLLVQKMHHDIYAKNFFIYSSVEKRFLNLDLYGELSKENIKLYNEKEIFSTLQYYEGYPILSPEKDFFTYLIKKLYKKDLNIENFLFLKNLYLKDKNKCDNLINKFLFKHSNLIKRSFEENDLNLLLTNRKNIIKKILEKKPSNFSLKLFNVIRIIKRLLNPTGISIAFLGPDGAGKSTIIESVTSSVLPFRRTDYFHLKPIINKSSNIDNQIDDPHKEKLYTALKSYMKLFYFVYQYNKGWIKNISKLKIKSSLIIFDRYYDDLLVDTKRYRFGGNVAIAKFIRNFIPQPDLYFILTTDAEVIYKRKQEVPYEELERQIDEYRKLGDEKRYFNIDVNRTPEEISNEIIEIIARKMNERF